MNLTPVDEDFTCEYFCTLVDTIVEKEKKSVKGLLTQDQIIPGLGNAIVQNILFKARLHPKHSINDLKKSQRKKLYNAIMKTVHEIIKRGGRYDE